MITNERQYKITKSCLRDFTEALARLSELPAIPKQPWLRTAQREWLEEQIAQLQKQIDQYKSLKSGEVKLPDPVTMVLQTPLVLIQSRIAKGWDQEELATRLGMAKQQIQRYEQNNYAQATLSVLSRVAAVLAGQPDPEMQSAAKVQETKPRSSSVKSKTHDQEKQKTKTRVAGATTPAKKAAAKRKPGSR